MTRLDTVIRTRCGYCGRNRPRGVTVNRPRAFEWGPGQAECCDASTRVPYAGIAPSPGPRKVRPAPPKRRRASRERTVPPRQVAERAVVATTTTTNDEPRPVFGRVFGWIAGCS